MKGKVSIPWFILWFIVTILINTYLLDAVPEAGLAISGLAFKKFAFTMFFIGASSLPMYTRQQR